MKTLYVLCSLMHRHEAIEEARLETAPEAEFLQRLPRATRRVALSLN